MGVDHGRADVGVAEQLLHGADVGAGLEQVGGERMAQGVDGRRLGDAGSGDGGLQIALQALLVQVMAMDDGRVAARIAADRGGGEDPEPGPALGRSLVLGGERVRR